MQKESDEPIESKSDTFLSIKDMSTFSFRFPLTLVNEIDKVAEQLNTSRSTLVRWCLRKGLYQAKKKLYSDDVEV